MDFVETSNAPAALGHYSQATVANGFIYTATQLPMNPNDTTAPKGSIKEQAHQVLNNIIEIVRAGGGDIDSIMRITIYVSDIKYWDEINSVYEKVMKDHMPARGVLEIKNIRKGYDVAMDAVAVVK